jgi:hypothetical protein
MDQGLSAHARALAHALAHGHGVDTDRQLSQFIINQKLEPLLVKNGAKFAKEANIAAARELVWRNEAESLFKSLIERDTDFVLMRGMGFGYCYFDRPWQRSLGDDHILVHEHKLGVARRVLEGLDFELSTKSNGFSGTKSFSWVDPFGQNRTDNKTISFLSRCPFVKSLNFSEAYAGSRGLDGFTNRVRALGASDGLMAALLAHMYPGAGDHFIWLHDAHLISQTLTEDEISIFVRKARENGCAQLCSERLGLIKSTYEISTIAPQVNRLQILLRAVVPSPVMNGGESPGLGLSYARWARHLFPSMDYMRVKYGLRPGLGGAISLPWVYGQRLVQRSFGQKKLAREYKIF